MDENKAAAEIAAWRAAAEDAHAWGDEMRLVMLAALFGTDRTGRNAAIGRILREWAAEQIEGAAAERARIAVYLRAQAGDDPWMSHIAGEILAGAHLRAGPDED